jgi:4-alpha-glucanotransferase
MYVLQYELSDSKQSTKQKRISKRSIASLNTHDMPTFAAYMQAIDIEIRRKLALLTEEAAQNEMIQRQKVIKNFKECLKKNELLTHETSDLISLLKASLLYLTMLPSQYVLINLEDLWLETEFQNIPTTINNFNWCRKIKYSIEQLANHEQTFELLQQLPSRKKLKI